MRIKSIVSESRQIQRAIALIKLGARLHASILLAGRHQEAA